MGPLAAAGTSRPVKPPAELRACLGAGLAQRSAALTCEARFRLGGEASLCFTPQAWSQWVAEPGPRCATFRGKWRLVSYRRNVADPQAKRVLRRFVAESFVREPGPPVRLARLERARRNLARELDRAGDHSGALRALVLSERPPTAPSDWLRALGFVHVFSAAGIHLLSLGLLWAWGFPRASAWLATRLGCTVPDARWLARVGFGLALAGWMFAWLLGGMRPGFMRPWLVWLARESTRISGLRARRWAPLTLAILLDVALAAAGFFGPLDESSLQGMAHGRWIYSLAVGGGALGLLAFPRSPHLGLAIGSWAPVAIAEGLSLAYVSVGTPILNLVSLPWFSWIVYPLLWLAGIGELLGVAASAWRPLLETAARGTEALLFQGCAAVSAGGALIAVPAAAWVIGLGLAAFVRGRALMIVCGLGLLARAAGGEIAPAAQRIEQLDVGQGDAAYLQLGGGFRALADAGPPADAAGLGAAEWLAILSARRATRLDAVILTHLDADHAGGLGVVRRLTRIGCVVATERAWATPEGRRLLAELRTERVGTPDTPCFDPQAVGIRLWDLSRPRERANPGMLGFYAPGGYLNLGDASAIQERELREKLGGLRVHVLKASHHGSRFSSDADFLASLRPARAWISAGVGNLHGHPTHEAIARLSRHSAQVQRTDLDGLLRLEVLRVYDDK